MKERRPACVWLALVSISGCCLAALGVLLGGPETLLGCLALGCIALFLLCLPPFRVAGCIVVLITLFYSVEDFGGWRAWRNYRRAWEARGERFDLASFVPAPVPEDQNFFASPFWAPLRFSGTNGTVAWQDPKHSDYTPLLVTSPNGYESPKSGNWMVARATDLAAWQSYYRRTNSWFTTNGAGIEALLSQRYGIKQALALPKQAPGTNYWPVSKAAGTPAADVLLALSKFETNRQLLIAASARPQARFWVNYDAGPATLLPHLGKLKASSQYLSLHACAALQDGDAKTALQDVRLMLRLIESVRSEPALISYLVRLALVPIALQPVWEGLADRRWTESDLTAIEAELARLDFLADYQAVMRGERASDIGLVDWLRKKGPGELGLLSGPSSNASSLRDFVAKSLFRLIPAGWFDQNKLSICLMHERYILPLEDPATGTVPPARVQTANTNIAQQLAGPYNLCSRLLLPALTVTAEKCARAQTSVDLARVACALERYRLAKGQFPVTLDALAPELLASLPRDVINGEPLKYRRTDDGQFVLYSVGWNETDDGGTAAATATGAPDWRQGDWVWRYPAR